ncbi:MAG: hypothetical protein U0232_07085 [Thermomicrobiales bacterium]
MLPALGCDRRAVHRRGAAGQYGRACWGGVYLRHYQLLPYLRISALLADLFGTGPSAARSPREPDPRRRAGRRRGGDQDGARRGPARPRGRTSIVSRGQGGGSMWRARRR